MTGNVGLKVRDVPHCKTGRGCEKSASLACTLDLQVTVVAWKGGGREREGRGG